MHAVAVIFTFIFFGSFAYADDLSSKDCSADISKYTAKGLSERIPVFKKDKANISPSKLTQFGFEDSAVLKNGTRVVFNIGGCAHYGFKFNFSGKTLAKVKTNEKIKRASTLLNSLALNSDYEKKTFIEALSKEATKKVNKWNDGVLYLDCGDATCTLTDKDNNEVEISYSFAL